MINACTRSQRFSFDLTPPREIIIYMRLDSGVCVWRWRVWGGGGGAELAHTLRHYKSLMNNKIYASTTTYR